MDEARTRSARMVLDGLFSRASLGIMLFNLMEQVGAEADVTSIFHRPVG
jgi:hypothetical protein